MSARFGNIRIEPKKGIGIGVTIDGTLDHPSFRPRFNWPLKEVRRQWDGLSYPEQDFVRALMSNGVTRVALIAEGADVYYRANFQGGYDEVVSGIMAGLFGSGLMGCGSSVTIVDEAGVAVRHYIDGTSVVEEVPRPRIRVILRDHIRTSGPRRESFSYDPLTGLVSVDIGALYGIELDWYVLPEGTEAVMRSRPMFVSTAGGIGPQIHPETDLLRALGFGNHADYVAWLRETAEKYAEAARQAETDED